MNLGRLTEQTIDDAIEAAYWQFDAMRKGLNEWKQCPKSERDAFKLICWGLCKGVFPVPKELLDHDALIREAREIAQYAMRVSSDGDHYDDDMVGRCNAFLDNTKGVHMSDPKELIRAMQRCGVAYVSGPNVRPCQRCGFREDTRMGACYECSEWVDGEPLGDGIHKLWDRQRPSNVWIVAEPS